MTATFVPNPNHPIKLQRAVQEGVNAFLLLVSTGLYTELSQAGTGRRYSRGKRKGKRRKGRNNRARGIHVASAPGRPPAADTGALRRSWQVSAAAAKTGSADGGKGPILRRLNALNMVGYRLGSPLPYAAIDRGYGRVKPRPYISPVLQDAAPSFPKIMSVALSRHFPQGASK